MNRKSMYVIVIVIIIMIVLAAIWAGKAGNTDSPDAVVRFLADTEVSFKCEVADTVQERAVGLMNRESLGIDSGMLFVFDSTGNLTFWMKNTLIPLDIIFIDAQGLVLNVEEADPEPGVADADLTRYSSDGVAKWVLEINQGLSAIHGIGPGTQAVIAMPR